MERRFKVGEIYDAFAVKSGEIVGRAAEVAPLYRFKIDDEAVPALWDGLRRELKGLADPKGLPEAVAKTLEHVFLCVLANLGKHIFEGVALPADGAGNAVLGLRVGGALKRL